MLLQIGPKLCLAINTESDMIETKTTQRTNLVRAASGGKSKRGGTRTNGGGGGGDSYHFAIKCFAMKFPIFYGESACAREREGGGGEWECGMIGECTIGFEENIWKIFVFIKVNSVILFLRIIVWHVASDFIIIYKKKMVNNKLINRCSIFHHSKTTTHLTRYRGK